MKEGVKICPKERGKGTISEGTGFCRSVAGLAAVPGLRQGSFCPAGLTGKGSALRSKWLVSAGRTDDRRSDRRTSDPPITLVLSLKRGRFLAMFLI